jgi:hypothetical protein
VVGTNCPAPAFWLATDLDAIAIEFDIDGVAMLYPAAPGSSFQLGRRQDENLVAEAMQLTNTATKKEVIHLGLRELIRIAKLRAVRNHRGKFAGSVT